MSPLNEHAELLLEVVSDWLSSKLVVEEVLEFNSCWILGAMFSLFLVVRDVMSFVENDPVDEVIDQFKNYR